MQDNPYRYTGPLHPIHDKLVCVNRKKELEQVISGILRGEYWTILGPSQMGKTTLLNQLIHELTAFNCIYFDMESCHNTDELFYNLLEDTITDNLLRDGFTIQTDNKKDFGHEINFYNFLISVEDKENKKIVLLFDEIERLPVVKPFLKLWRKIFSERNFHPELNKYAVIIAGSVDLIELTIGKTSPFNISKKLYLGELPMPEAKALIDNPMKKLGIIIDSEAKNEIINLTSCHPQLMQHLCYLLVEQALNNNKHISKPDVENAIEILYVESDNLSTLANEISSDKTLLQLIEKILSGDQVHYLPFKKYSIAGTGPIIMRQKFCTIRNKIYQEFIHSITDQKMDDPVVEDEPNYLTTIFLKGLAKNSLLNNSAEKLLKYLFGSDSIEIQITKNGEKLAQFDLDFKERLIFCYLAYKKYQALRKGYSDWKKIPLGSEFRLSS
ncbi:MAG: AAA-like domain-containing protein, partial [Candidatus Atribacteria bacterium]|nr:AAA-like domain-containing protein [Candidatus Atribacteria bacterium]